jgi:hypothetical protein
LNSSIGIDVGLSGGICFINNNALDIYSIPTLEVSNSAYSRWFDIPNIVGILNKYDKNTKINLEYQRPFERQSIVSTFRLGRGFGLLEGVVSTIFSSVEIVDPKAWQNLLIKKFLTTEEKELVKSKDKNDFIKLLPNIDSKYHDFFIKKVETKSFKNTKLRAFYLLCKSGYIEKMDKDLYKKHDLVDCVLIALYGFLKHN